MDPAHLERFAGIGRLYGRAGMERLARASFMVVGLGGVGSWTAEALARSGVGHLALVDGDSVCVSNTNRQLHAVAGNLGSQARFDYSKQSAHRTWALTSMGVALASYVMMLEPLRRD